MKSFVLDTNVLLQDPYSIFKFGYNKVIIPIIVLEEVDDKKKLMDELGKNARTVSRLFDAIREEQPGQLINGVQLETGGILQIEMNHVSFEKLKDIFPEKSNDNRILAVAKNLQDETPNETVIVVSMDGNVRIKADALGLIAENYESDRLVEDADNLHKGYHEIFVDSHFISLFYANGELDYQLVEPFVEEEVFVQDFFVLKDESGANSFAIGRLLNKSGVKKIVKLFSNAEKGIWGIKPKNSKQKMLFELLMDENVKLVCVTGQAGTGKTLLALASGLLQTETFGKYKKILAARPVIPMGNDIGFLPGDMNEKLRPWMQPIYDNLEFLFDIDKEREVEKENKKTKDSDKDEKKDKIELIVEKLKLDIEALTYIRGRSIPQQFIIIDEAQNLTKHEVKTIITRSGEGTKIILLGDPDQIDKAYLDATNNGLTYVIEKMKQEEEVGIIRLEKTERSTLAEKAAKLL